MCGQYQTPTGGIPITSEIHEKFPENVKQAFEIFHGWLLDQDQPIKISSMPPEIASAYQTIKGASIPVYNVSCQQSCYVLSVEKMLQD